MSFVIFLILVLMNAFALLQYKTAGLSLFDMQRTEEYIGNPLNITVWSIGIFFILILLMHLVIHLFKKKRPHNNIYYVGVTVFGINCLLFIYWFIWDFSLLGESVFGNYALVQDTLIWLLNFISILRLVTLIRKKTGG